MHRSSVKKIIEDTEGEATRLIPDLGAHHFARISRLVRQICGIHLPEGKEQLVKTRLWKRLRVLGLESYGAYVDLIESKQGIEELRSMVDALTTNKTQFFREPQHLDFLRSKLECGLRDQPKVRIWSAGCSSGEEPYSIAMTALDALGVGAISRVRVLATDISVRILHRAHEGSYEVSEVANIPVDLFRHYFVAVRTRGRTVYRVGDRVRQMVRFARLNLLDSWPMQGPFDFIFCRNVMIYFDRPTQQRLLARFRALLIPGGHLILGHAESLAGRDQGLVYVMPAVYRR